VGLVANYCKGGKGACGAAAMSELPRYDRAEGRNNIGAAPKAAPTVPQPYTKHGLRVI